MNYILLVACVLYVTLCIKSNNLFVSGTSCVWTVDNFILDLSGLSSTILSYNDSSNPTKFVYEYTPCKNGLTCDSVDGGYYMATQTGNTCHYLAKWNATVQPKLSNGSYTLTYKNGADGLSFVFLYLLMFNFLFICLY